MQTNLISNLLNLKGVKVKKTENSKDFVKIHLETPVTTQVCPSCKYDVKKIKGYHTQTIKDIPFQLKPTYLVLKKRRHKCTHCGCTFFEKLDFLPRYARKTTRVTEYIVEGLRSLTSAKNIAKSVNVSSYTVTRLLPYLANPVVSMPKVLCIDEFRGNVGYEKFQLSLVDWESKKFVDILECRHKHFLCDYFKKIPLIERKKVKYVVIDMYKPYADVISTYFPSAKIVVDKFHYVRYANWIVNKLRIEVQKKLPKEERKFFKNSRKLLLSRRSNLKNDQQKDNLNYILINFSEELRIAYREKEMLLDIVHNPNSEEATRLFNEWVTRNVSSDISLLRECAKMFHRWSWHIRNSLNCPYTNGPIEGLNNKIKVLKRIGFGFRNFDNFKARIMLLN